MNLKINIEEDKELRLYIKDLIKGQVLSIAREEISDIIREVASGKLKNTPDSKTIDTIIREEIKKLLDRELPSSGWNNPGFFKSEARILLESRFKEFLKHNDLIK